MIMVLAALIVAHVYFNVENMINLTACIEFLKIVLTFFLTTYIMLQTFVTLQTYGISVLY